MALHVSYETLGHLLLQLQTDSPPISSLNTDQQVATTWIWFDEWDAAQRQYMLDRLLIVCTAAPPKPPAAQDELVGLLETMQLQEGPRLAFKDENSSDPGVAITINYDKQIEYIFNWYDQWSPELRWLCFSGLQAIDGSLMADFYNSMNAMQGFFDLGDLATAVDQAPTHPLNNGTMTNQNLPLTEQWFHDSRNCECCLGYVYKCSGAICRQIGGCACRYASGNF